MSDPATIDTKRGEGEADKDKNARMIKLSVVTKTQTNQSLWRLVKTAMPTPIRRCYHSSIAINGKVYFYGGYEISIGILSEFAFIDLTAPEAVQFRPVPVSNPGESPGKLIFG